MRKDGGTLNRSAVVIAIIVVASVTSCRRSADRGGSTAKQPLGKPAVFADIGPVAYLVEQIGGGHVDVDTLVPAKADPHIFEPTPRQIVALSNASIYFSSDMPFDRQIRSKIGDSVESLSIVDTTAGIKKHSLSCGHNCTHGDHAHDHARQHEPGHIDNDPHVWLSPPLLAVMAKNIATALEEVDPAHADEYQANLAQLSKKIDETDRTLTRRLEPYRGRSFYVFHPAFGYLAEHYGLKQVAVQLEGREPTPKHLAKLIEQAKADRIGVVFVQGQFDQRAAQTVAKSIDAKLVTIDPLAKDVLANLDKLSRKVAETMK
ncbi:MAG: zinc ABC transporter substrate-binding protein, partial [Planctomycetota bacterium]|nr:zinc ABC transporter substrate-binding protein [Planctomycetota bacterium]